MKIQNILIALLIMSSYATYARSAKKDTTFLLKEKRRIGYHTVFIDTNPKSAFYRTITDFSFISDDAKRYASSLEFFKGQKLTRFTNRKFPRKWIELYQYKGKFYVYYPSDFYFEYKIRITDSTYIIHTGEGPVANKIISFSKVDSSTYRFRLTGQYGRNRKLTVHIIDPQKGIAVFEENVDGQGKNYFLMIAADKARNLPLIVNYSRAQKEEEFNFKPPNYRKLLNMNTPKDSIRSMLKKAIPGGNQAPIDTSEAAKRGERI